ncbi:MAG: Flp family type IVb pilin [Myxococcota bacterium]
MDTDPTNPSAPPALTSSACRPRARDRRGSTAIEYGLIVSLMTIVILGAMYQVYAAVATMWNAIAAAMP